MKRIGIPVAALMLAACQDQTMTGVERGAVSRSPSFTVQGSSAENARIAIDDVMAGIVPALSDADAAQGLVAAFQGLQQAVDAGGAAATPGLLLAAQTALDHYGENASANAAEVDAMRLALETVSG